MRVVSLVPSWTETLIESGVDVVGRTRFCVHPKNRVKSIPIVGGTKSVKTEDIKSLNPDLVIFDQEENTKEMFEECSLPKWASHVTNIASMQEELILLGKRLDNQYLCDLGHKEIPNKPKAEDIHFLPGVLKWVSAPPKEFKLEKLHYLIWKNPWMEVTRETYIGSVLDRFGLASFLPVGANKYPEVSWEVLVEPGSLILLSSEPFPFEKHLEEFEGLNLPVALVNGESYSWFGSRSLKFLLEQ